MELIPVCEYVKFVAPDMLVKVVLSGDDCHWYVKPLATVVPERLHRNTVEVPPEEGDATAEPAVGVPEQAPAPFPETGILTADVKPPPVTVTLPV